jgi:CheY-like chemotaxis protein
MVQFLSTSRKRNNMESAKNFKIFLVDDDAFNLALTQYHLKSLGYKETMLFSNGTD